MKDKWKVLFAVLWTSILLVGFGLLIEINILYIFPFSVAFALDAFLIELAAFLFWIDE